MRELTPAQVKSLLDARAAPAPILLDVRSAEELAMARLPQARHIPMGELPQRADELDRDAPLVVMCHHGVRSRMAGEWLERHGFTDVSHLGGGIDAWSLELDAAIPRY